MIRLPALSQSRFILISALAALSAPAILAVPSPLQAETIVTRVDHQISDDRLTYVLLQRGHDRSTINGTTEDLARAESYRKGNEPLLYARQDGVGYVIRDPALLSRAEAIIEPQTALGEQQGELGRQQGELGREQGQLGAEQGRLGALMADARPSEMRELGRRQAELGRRQGELGRKQGELGRRQGELGEEQGRLARLAQDKFRNLVDEAIRRGIAQRVD